MKKIKHKILFCIDQQNLGGAEKFLYKLYKNFQSQFNIDYLIIKNFEPIWFLPSYLTNIYSLISKKFSITHQNNLIISFKHIYLLVRLVKLNNYKLILSFLERSNIFSVTASLLTGVPAIINVRNHLSSQYENRVFYQRYLIYLIIKTLYPRADLIICNSYEIKYDLHINFSIPLNKCFVIYNFYDINFIIKSSLKKPDIDDSFYKKILSFQNKYIAVGRLCRQKDFITLIKTFIKYTEFKKNNNSILVIVGEGDEHDELLKLSKNQNIYFIPYNSNPYALFNIFDFYISTSRYEGFPNTLVESMLCECYPISTDCSSGPMEIINGTFNIRKLKSILYTQKGVIVPLQNEKSINKYLFNVFLDLHSSKVNINFDNKYNYSINNIVPKWNKCINITLFNQTLV